jgi:hypothetical protein
MFCEEERALKVRIIHISSDEEILTQKNVLNLPQELVRKSFLW